MTPSRTAAELDELSETPMTREELDAAPRVPRVKSLRRALGLTQEQFSQTYRIPLATMRDWETGASEPVAPAQALLQAIALEPDLTAKALNRQDAACGRQSNALSP